MCVQWYRPDLQPSRDNSASGSDPLDTLFLYAFNSKAVTASPSSGVLKAGGCVVSADGFLALHEELMETLEMAESDLKAVSSQSGQGTSTF